MGTFVPVEPLQPTPPTYAQCSGVGWLFNSDYRVTGTGFLINDQWIATASHIVGDANSASDFLIVFGFDNTTAPSQRTVRCLAPELGFINIGGPSNEITLVKLDRPLSNSYIPYPVKPAVPPSVGLEITCIQQPLSQPGNVPPPPFPLLPPPPIKKAYSKGAIREIRDFGYFTHDAETNSGSSGSPILTGKNELVGVHLGMDPKGTKKLAAAIGGIPLSLLDQLMTQSNAMTEAMT